VTTPPTLTSTDTAGHLSGSGPGTDTALTIEGVTVTFGHGASAKSALNGITTHVGRGRTVGLVGESGSGKSTLAKAIIGQHPPTSGRILLDGVDLATLGRRERFAVRRRIQLIPQDPYSSLDPRRTIGQALAEAISPLHENVRANKDRIAEWLEHVRLSPDSMHRYPHEFSGGQRQRIAIARALAARPDLLVADEPISALDASSQAAVAEMMRVLAIDSGAGLLFISHDLAVVRLIADRTVVMYRGRIVESGVTEKVWNDPSHPYTRSLVAAIPKPDGQGHLPAAPTSAERERWLDVVPEALDRV